ncbi:MAG TPA: hypothetical protein VFQ92_23250 [Blastocatellia bacterium]|nr:hypothetical protein [Blastocatellia bacterium]
MAQYALRAARPALLALVLYGSDNLSALERAYLEESLATVLKIRTLKRPQPIG